MATKKTAPKKSESKPIKVESHTKAGAMMAYGKPMQKERPPMTSKKNSKKTKSLKVKSQTKAGLLPAV